MSLSLSFGFEKGTLFSSSSNRFEHSFSECSSPPETPRSEVFDFSDDESVASTCSSLQLSPARWRPSLRRKYGLGLSQGSPPRDRRSQQRQWKEDEMASSPPSLSDRCVMLLDAPWCEKRPHPRASPRSSQNSSPPAHPSTSTESCGRTRTVHAQSAPVESAHNEMVMRRLQCMRQTQDLVGELRSIREAGQRLRDRQLELRRLKRQKVGELQLMELEMASAWYGRDWLGLEIPAQSTSLETAPSHTIEGPNVLPLLKQHGGQLIPRPGAADMLRGLDLGSLIGMGEEELEDMEFDLRKDEKEKRLKLELARVTDALNTGKLEGRRLVAVASQKRAMLRHVREELASVQALLRTERISRCNSEPADPPTPSSVRPTASITSTAATTLAQSKLSSPVPHSPIPDSPSATSPASSNSPTSNSAVEQSIPPGSPQVVVPSRFSEAKSEGPSPPSARQRREFRRGRSAGDIPYAETPSPEKHRKDAVAAERSGVRSWVSNTAAVLSSSPDQVPIGVPVPGDSAATQRGRRRFSEGDIDICGVWETGDRRVVEVVPRWRTRANGWAVDVVDGKPAWVHSVPGKSPSSHSPRKLQTSPQKASGFGQVGEALQRTESSRKGTPTVNRRLNYGHGGGGGGGPDAESSNKEEEVEKGRSRRKGVAELERREAWVARPKSDASEEERGEGWTIEFVRGRPKWVRATKPLPQPGESPRRGGFVEVRVILGVKEEEEENDGSLSGAKLGSSSEMSKDLSQTAEEDDGAGVTLHLEVNSRERDDVKGGSANLVGELGERSVHGEEGMSVEEALPRKAEEVAMKKGLQGPVQGAKEGTATKGLSGVVAPARVGPAVANDGGRTTDRARRAMSAPPDLPRGRLDSGGRQGSTNSVNMKGVNSHQALVRKGDSLGGFSGRFGMGRTGPEKGRRTLKVAAVNMLRDIVGWPMLTRGGFRALASPGKSRLETASMREELEVVTPPRIDLAGKADLKEAEVESSRMPESVGPHGTPVAVEEAGNDRGTECEVMQAETTAVVQEGREVPSGEECTSALSTASMGYERVAGSGSDAAEAPAAGGILETLGADRAADESIEQQTLMVMGVTRSDVEMPGRAVGGEEGMVAVVPSVGACNELGELSVPAHSSSSCVLPTGAATREEEAGSSEGFESGLGVRSNNAEGSDGLRCQPSLEDVEGRADANAQRGGKEAETGFFASGDDRECEIQPCDVAEECCSKAVEIEISEITSSTLFPGGSKDVSEGVSGIAGEDVGYLQPCDDESGDLSDGDKWGLGSMFCKVNGPVIPAGLTVASEDGGEVVDQEVVIGTVEESVEVVTKNVVMFHTSESRDGGSDKYTEDDFPEVAAATVNRFLWSFGEEEAEFDGVMGIPGSEGETIFDEGMEKPVAGDLTPSFCQEKETGCAGAAFDEHVSVPKVGEGVFVDDIIFPGKMLKATKGSLTGSGESNNKQELLQAAEELVFGMEGLSGCESSEKVELDEIVVVTERGVQELGEGAELDVNQEVDSAKEHMSDCEEVRTPRSGGLAELFGAALGLYWPLGQQNGKSSPRESLSPGSGSANGTDSEGEKVGVPSLQSMAGTWPARNGILKAREEEASHGGSAKGTPRTSPLSRISTGTTVDEESSNAKRAASESQRWLLELYGSVEQAAEGVVSPPMLQL